MHLVNTQTNHKVTINQKEKINCVRMFLGVQYASEICTIDGTSFVPGMLEKNVTTNSIIKQHSRNPTKENQESTVGCYGDGY